MICTSSIPKQAYAQTVLNRFGVRKKSHKNNDRGCDRKFLSSYLDEFVWRYTKSEIRFQTCEYMFQEIAAQHYFSVLSL